MSESPILRIAREAPRSPVLALADGILREDPITRIAREHPFPPLVDPAIAALLTPRWVTAARELAPLLSPLPIRSTTP